MLAVNPWTPVVHEGGKPREVAPPSEDRAVDPVGGSDGPEPEAEIRHPRFNPNDDYYFEKLANTETDTAYIKAAQKLVASHSIRIRIADEDEPIVAEEDDRSGAWVEAMVFVPASHIQRKGPK